MGERLYGDAVPGRRRVHPDGAVSGSWDVSDAAALETALASALRGDFDPEAEQQAVAAFRAARSAGVHRARTRRRDDWRLPAERRSRRPVKMTFAAVFASLALGGVAVAAIGSAGSGSSADGAGRVTASPSSVARGGAGGESPSPSSGDPGATNGPARAQDTEAHCRAYEQVRDRGKALDATAWQQLVAAAGGKDKVAAYCSEKLTQATATPNKPGSTGRPGGGAADNGKGTAGTTGASGNGGTSGNGTSGNTGTSGNGTSGAGTSGDASGGTGNAAGHGRSGGKHQ
ncbi:hypothetical protein RKE30_00825 [Streptomyces sp. Li-HN-5-11]|uniref:hypothetical protein n=1 Tax=Streptomyces sp. Li-HN-5-11 TaxID=3075432 RepID=UPI0028B1F647|nr:hypothetical protein [Streptomyces sp. Li-HN-5-11]WNM29051.1 hypothetical protein RKE30_00825 [Streptomyces sp. Li-HN-5-11]